MPAPDVRMMNVANENLNDGTAKHLAKLFGEIADRPKDVKESRGRFIVQFPGFDEDPRPNYSIPEIRQFIGTLDRACPHALYFLNEDPAINYIHFYLLCLVMVHPNKGGWAYNLNDLINIAIDRCNHVAAFCEKIRVDHESVIDGIFTNLPPEALISHPPAAARALRAMKPTLQMIRTDFHSLLLRPDGRALIRHVVGRAATLCGLSAGDKPSEALVDQILSRIKED